MKTAKFLLALSCCIAITAEAHRAWFLPNATVLSSDDPWVSVDAAVSNDIFHADHAPMRLEGVTAIAPVGSEVALQNASTGKYRSVFDVQLKQKGTYKIVSASAGIMATWKTPDGERRMWPGRGERGNPADLQKNIPKDAKDLEVTQFSRRMETFVTAGSPDNKALKITKQGLELLPVTHPNDLFAGETAEFQFFMDGKAIEGVKVTVIPGGMRYRNDQDAIELTSDKNGKISVTWPTAGMYWLNAQYRDNKAKKPATLRTGGYVATFEVLPE